jgi:hypothetical protein
MRTDGAAYLISKHLFDLVDLAQILDLPRALVSSVDNLLDLGTGGFDVGLVGMVIGSCSIQFLCECSQSTWVLVFAAGASFYIHARAAGICTIAGAASPRNLGVPDFDIRVSLPGYRE